MAAPRVALVTGSGRRRIGWHVARALAGRGYGLAIHYHTAELDAATTVREIEDQGVQAMAIAADIRDERAVGSMVDQVLARFGRLDVLVNCAGVWHKKRLEDVGAADVRLHFETNTLGTFLCARGAGLAMVKQDEGGTIVNLSDWAQVRPYLNYAAYFPATGAIPTLTRSLAIELGSRNPRVRVNCILAGPVLLPPDLPEAERRHAIEATLVQHEGRPENIAQAVLHFIDNDFVTGVCLPVDGGRSIYTTDSLI